MKHRLRVFFAAAALAITLATPAIAQQDIRESRERQKIAELKANAGEWTHVRRVTGRLQASELEDVAVRLSIAPHRERVFQYRFRVEHTPERPFLKAVVRSPEGDVAISEGRDGWVEASIGIPTRGRRAAYQVVLTRVASRNRTAFDYEIVIERREVGEPVEPPPPPPPTSATATATATATAAAAAAAAAASTDDGASHSAQCPQGVLVYFVRPHQGNDAEHGGLPDRGAVRSTREDLHRSRRAACRRSRLLRACPQWWSGYVRYPGPTERRGRSKLLHPGGYELHGWS